MSTSSRELGLSQIVPEQPRPTARQQFRPDVEGLRAVAILLVVAYHAGVTLLPGGFVGVDVFFVISGFLITGLLVAELRERGRVSIPAFYARRVRRLLPAIVVMVLVVAALSWVALSPLRRADLGADVVAAGLFVANWRFASQAVDYLASQQDPSAMLHMWSLSVEEQFYLVWPALLIGLSLVAGRVGRRGRTRVLLAGMGVIFVLSLLLSWRQTQTEAGLAYFSSFTRAWELALGGLLALLVPTLRRLPRPVAALLGWFGTAAVVVAALRITASTPFPGLVALAPTLGAAGVIAAGASLPRDGVGRVLSSAPMRRVGRLSYGWYLWHWPLLVLAAVWVGGELSLPAGIAVVAVAYGLAVLSLRYVEDPVRRAPVLARSTGRALLVGLVCTGVVVSTGLLLRTGTVAAELAPGQALGAAALTPTNPSRPGGSDGGGGTGSAAPPIQESAEAVAPAPQDAGDDLPVLYGDGCHRLFSDTSVDGCVFGDPDSATTVVLFGDSHAATWFPALDRLARQQQWRLVALTKSGCPAKEVLPYNSTLKRSYDECVQWRENALARIAREHPALVLTTSINGYSVVEDGRTVDDDRGRELETAGWVDTLDALVADAGNVVLLRDVPDMGQDVAGCVSQHMDNLVECSVARKKAIVVGQSDELAQTELGQVDGLHYLDLNDLICPGARCPAVIGNVLVYRDKDHLTATYVKTLAPALLDRLRPWLP